jgi:hypothetical protein
MEQIRRVHEPLVAVLQQRHLERRRSGRIRITNDLDILAAAAERNRIGDGKPRHGAEQHAQNN